MTKGTTQEWCAQLARDGRVEVGLRTRRLWGLTAVSLLFVLAGLAMIGSDSGSDRVAGWVCVLLFGFGLVLFPRQALQRGPAVVVDAQGISAPRHGTVIPWDAATGTAVFSHRGTDLVQVAADTDFLDRHYESHPVQARARSANRLLTGGVESLSLPSPLAVDAEEFARWLGEEIQRRRTSAV